MSTFRARYSGRCSSCNGRIEPGDEVGYTADSELVHVDCYDADEPEPDIPEVCTTCYLTHPCEHDEDNP